MKTVLVIGTGSLARHVTGSLAAGWSGRRGPDLRLVVAGRSLDRATEVAYLAASRARLAGCPVETAAAEIEPLSWAGHHRLVETVRPDCVLLCASLNSPWEQSATATGWSRLLARTGGAAALALQAAVGRRAAPAAAQRSVPLINACYPDAVNPLLAALGSAPFSGVGNVALIAASLASALGLGPEQRLQVVAHHWHLSRSVAAADEALAFVDGVPVPDVGDRLARQRAVPRPDLNHVTGLSAARLVTGLLGEAPFHAHVPGPAGLPGGYPVRVTDGRCVLDLPAGLDQRQAVAANTGWAARAGVVVDGGRVRFSATAADALAGVLPAFAEGFDAEALDEVETATMAVRDRLRRVPGDSGPR
jgi:hypothetical protein